jgi:release factor glutamine methyltransferase
VGRKDTATGADHVRRPPAGPADRVAALLGSRREAEWIVDHVDDVLGLEGPARDEAVGALAARRAMGEPLQYVLGRWPFRGIELEVDGRVLIPRPETEQVVEVALARLARSRSERAGRRGEPTTCCDLGTGSGAIALSLAAEAPSGPSGLEVWAIDRSTEALDVARANRDRLARAGRLPTARVEFAEGDWYDALPAALMGSLDLVVANPPYVAEAEYVDLESTVRCFEPTSALVAGPGAQGTPGMADVEAILLGARRWLRPGGTVVVEMAPHQAEPARATARAAGLAGVAVEPDLAGRLRMVVAQC